MDVQQNRIQGAVEVDAVDRQLLRLLRDDGRRPNAEIARALGVSEHTVRKRLDRLRDKGVLRIIGLLDPAATGFPVDVLIGIGVRHGLVREVGRRLAAQGCVAFVGHTTGRYDLIVEAVFQDNDALLAFLGDTLATMRGITKTEAFHVRGVEKFKYMWDLPADGSSEWRATLTKGEAIDQAIASILAMDEEAAVRVAEDVLASALDPLEVLEGGFTVGMRKVGDLFAGEEMGVHELALAADAMKGALGILESAMPRRVKGQDHGTVVIGTVEGDVHDIGKTILVTMFEVSGFTVHDLGRNVPVDVFVKAVEDHDADLVGSSALMTTTMFMQQRLELALKAAGLRDRVKTMVGGGAATQGWADKIGADIYADNATDAVLRAKEARA
ncbi:MAG: cobalamin-dependent protein [Thermoleophilia bacterium]|nr:cobalamin-dependent protein [Thermoleophilia bacterium]